VEKHLASGRKNLLGISSEEWHCLSRIELPELLANLPIGYMQHHIPSSPLEELIRNLGIPVW
jgi:hypothetical protein